MRPLPSIPAALAVLATTFAFSRTGAAQEADPVSATGKGITGGALLGAEAVMLVEAAFEVKPAWAYVVGGLAGGIGGGVGGFFVEDSDPKLSMYLLAGGMALVIPTTVAVLSATRYEPKVDYTEDRGPIDEPVAEPPRPDEPPGGAEPAAPSGSSGPAPRRAGDPARLRLPPPSLVALDDEGLRLSVPAVEVRDVFTRREVADLGIRQETEVRVPVISVTF